VWLKSFLLWGILTLLCGGIYPLVVTLLAQGLFPRQANGSMSIMEGRLVGSDLLGQKNNMAGYFHERPSACDHFTLPSGASNAAPTSSALADSIKERRSRFIHENGLSPDAVVPDEMLTASASGLDPHISPESARLQVNRIAAERHWDDSVKGELLDQIARLTEVRQFGVLGEPRVNVLKLNILLDEDSRLRILK
jgi:potassium-transporting ATPase KdpC subunit